uniref:Uncharacterized protein n=1 Tax=Anopheles albimanus TaxID=7167 RepID=A0A182FQ27_ANOAL
MLRHDRIGLGRIRQPVLVLGVHAEIVQLVEAQVADLQFVTGEPPSSSGAFQHSTRCSPPYDSTPMFSGRLGRSSTFTLHVAISYPDGFFSINRYCLVSARTLFTTTMLAASSVSCVWKRLSRSSSSSSLANQVATGFGNAVYGTWMLKSSPARTVMSRTLRRSIIGLFGCSCSVTEMLGRDGSDAPISLTAINRN